MDTVTMVNHKFLADSGMSFQEVFDFAFGSLIPELQCLAREFGEERFLETLSDAASKLAFQAGREMVR